jgi:YggT family protein
MIYALIQTVHLISRVISLIVIVDVVLSYFMSPYQPIRQTLDRIVEPMLRPIRRILPSIGMIDFSPVVLIILIQVLDSIITGILVSLLQV